MPRVVAHFLHLALLKQTKRQVFKRTRVRFASSLIQVLLRIPTSPQNNRFRTKRRSTQRRRCNMQPRRAIGRILSLAHDLQSFTRRLPYCCKGRHWPRVADPMTSHDEFQPKPISRKAFNLLCSSLLPFERHSLELLRAARSCCFLLLKQQKGPNFVIHVFGIWYSLDSRSHLILFCNYRILYFLYRSNSIRYQFWDQ